LALATLSCWTASSLAFISSAYWRPDAIFCWRSSSVASTGLNANFQRMKATIRKLSICARMNGQLMPKSCTIFVMPDGGLGLGGRAPRPGRG
jgi:hypothetical protein